MIQEHGIERMRGRLGQPEPSSGLLRPLPTPADLRQQLRLKVRFFPEHRSPLLQLCVRRVAFVPLRPSARDHHPDVYRLRLQSRHGLVEQRRAEVARYLGAVAQPADVCLFFFSKKKEEGGKGDKVVQGVGFVAVKDWTYLGFEEHLGPLGLLLVRCYQPAVTV